MKECRDVNYLSRTVEFEKKKRSRVQETYEHEGRPESFGPSASQGAGAADCVSDVAGTLRGHLSLWVRLSGRLLTMIRPSGDRLLFLRKSTDIERVKKHGRRFQTPLFNMLSCPSGSLQKTRIGIVVGKRFGGAVNRNRAKRVFRELVREVRKQLVVGRELLVFPRRAALLVRHRLLQDAWKAALRHEGLMVAELGQRCDNSASV